MNRRWALVAPLLVMTACQDEAPADETGAGGRAEGEVLGGTISDDMLPLDTLRSQSPPLRPSAEATGGEASGDGGATASPSEEAASEEPGEAAEDADPQPEPETE
ncbi:hypothetical protein [Qipengyuania spongiae]|uniref:Uncharacterized protein n=1 Tax=Qipengyuania spongiae TaxID=2909673 RepID=A0ABY5T0H8_9SPHN|nr:hypothetical protein [Qipengyuania spongiae]UVI40307.1 hypothetical protein L1F33_05025 [Qipengyuania spongiae]